MSEISQVKVKNWRIQVLMFGLLAGSLLVFIWTVSFQVMPEAQEIRLQGDATDGFIRLVKPPAARSMTLQGI